VRFHQYLQWLCETQLAEAAGRAGGMELGLCRDLAVGAAPDGAEAWAQSALLAQGVSIGAPPDPLGPEGQVWGLPPFDPHLLKADDCGALAELFGANMRHAGALRIDHVMGLARQFWVPRGAEAADGAYVAFPLKSALRRLASESERAGCLVIGEDLGTVPEGLRETLAEGAVLSYRVLPFEREVARFKRSETYPSLAMACVASHDLPTLAGWWAGLDIDERLGLGLIDEAQAGSARAARLQDKQALLDALPDTAAEAGPLTPALAGAIHAFIARTPSFLAMAQLEDLAGEREAVNMPGTDRERPNWRRRIARPLETLIDMEPAVSILAGLSAGRAGRG
jgi:glycogen operon protein